MVLTTVPAPYNESSRYTQDDQLVMYMFYSPPDGSIKKYAIWANSTTGQSRPVLESDGSMPPRSFNALSCQIQNGTETIFGVNGNQTIEQWYRLFDTENSTWIQSRSIPPLPILRLTHITSETQLKHTSYRSPISQFDRHIV